MSVPYLLQNPTFPKTRPVAFSPSQSEMVRMICEIAEDQRLSANDVVSEFETQRTNLTRQQA